MKNSVALKFFKASNMNVQYRMKCQNDKSFSLLFCAKCFPVCFYSEPCTTFITILANVYLFHIQFLYVKS